MSRIAFRMISDELLWAALIFERAEEVIRKLLAEGILFNPREGKIRRAQS
jgi:hypothetical protein